MAKPRASTPSMSAGTVAISSQPSAFAARSVSVTPTGGISATDAQAALAELDSEALKKAANLSDVANAATSLANLGGLAIAGGTMGGALTLAGPPASALEAATKAYADGVPNGMLAGQCILALASTTNLRLDPKNGNKLFVNGAWYTIPAAGVTVSNSGTAANNYGPFLPLANGDTGIQNVASVTFSAASGAGVGALCLARPLLTLPITTVSVAAERDLLNQLPSLPRIVDGACLTWLYFAGAATAASTNFFGSLEAGWG